MPLDRLPICAILLSGDDAAGSAAHQIVTKPSVGIGKSVENSDFDNHPLTVLYFPPQN